MRFPVRRIVLGFAVGAGAGWVAGLLRRPKDAPAGTGADAAEHMPQEEFGDAEPVEGAEPVADAEPLEGAEPVEDAEPFEGAEEIAQEPTAPAEAFEDQAEEHPPPRKAVPEMLTPPPGRETEVGEAGAADGDGESQPATPPEAGVERIDETKPARRRTRARSDAAAVAEPVSEAAREGREDVAQRLAGLENIVPPRSTRRPRKP